MVYSKRVLAQSKGKGLLAIFFQTREEKQNKILAGKKLLEAIAESNISEIVKTLTHYPELIRGIGKNNPPPLYVAVMNSNAKVVATLIKMGADVNQSYGKDFQFPLHQACWRSGNRNKRDMILLLLNNGALVNERNYRGDTPLHITNDLESAKVLLKFGADIHAKDVNGRTPLLSKVFHYGDVELIKLLVKLGSKITEKDHDGENIIDYIHMKESLGWDSKIGLKLRELFPRKLFE
jgi:ankyrin repeat protein